MSLSGEEFSRLQSQILDLRKANYELKDKLDKQTNENSGLREILQRQKVELTKNKVQGSLLSTISKVGRNQDTEQLSQERDKLQQKLQQQEEEFKLQNNTLLAEVEKLQSDNNALQRQINELQSSSENTSLHKRLQLNGESDIGTTEENSECASESSLDVDGLHEERKIISDQMRDAQASYKFDNDKLKSEVEKLQEKVRKKQESIVLLQEEKEHLYNDNARLQDEIKHMAVDKQKELAAEKEKFNSSISLKNEEIDQLKSFSTNRIKELEAVISSLTKETTETVNISSRQTAELEVALKEASERFDSQCLLHRQLQVAHDDLVAVNESLKQHRATLEEELDKAKLENEDFRATLDDMKLSVGNLTAENGKNFAKIRQLETSLEEASALAEKRKNMMEDIATQCQKSVEQLKAEHKSAIHNESQLREELKLCQLQNCELEAQMHKLTEENSALSGVLDQLKRQNAELRTNLSSCEEKLSAVTSELEVKVSALETQHSTTCKEYKKQIEDLKKDLEIQGGAMKKSSARISDLEQQVLDKVEERRIGEQKLVVKLKDIQKVAKQEKQRADKLEAKLKDFLSNAPKLDSIKTGYDDVYLSVSPAKYSNSALGAGGDGDSLSVSSFGQLSDLPFTASPNYQSQSTANAAHSAQDGVPTFSQSQIANGCAAEDIQHLFDRIADLQQEKWMLEEKLSHLETNCASLSDDLIEKSRIIENYIIEKGHIDRTCSPSSSTNNFSAESTNQQQQQQPLTGQMLKQGLKNRMREFIKQDELSSRDVNKRLQNMLEETLTKNIQLQKDVDMLSGELAKLQH